MSFAMEIGRTAREDQSTSPAAMRQIFHVRSEELTRKRETRSDSDDVISVSPGHGKKDFLDIPESV